MTLSPQWLDELRARTLLSALIGKSIKITKAGREYKGCCPFHNEKTPSFYVNDEKGFYHCFGCSAHGDAIRWMTDQRGLGFMDAVKELADAAGMEVPAPDPRAAEKAERGNALFDVMAAAQDWFVTQLGGIEGAEARAYLDKRGIKPETIQVFGIGYAPESKSKLKAALSNFGNDKLVEAGLLISVEEKEPYDRFRGRLMIPIRDPRGRVIAFGGRILGAGEPKYLNSPDTPLFDKGRTLYNLDLAGPASRKTNRMIVVEGYMDVIALAQAGIGDAVAPLGTALTEHQIARLWRMSSAPILCFDGDSAGQKASIRALGRALPGIEPDRSLCFATLPPGQDPDDVLQSSGRSAMDALLGAAEPLVDRLWAHERDAAPLATPEARAGLKQRLNEHVQAIAHGDLRAQYGQEFNRRFADLFPSARRDGFASGGFQQNSFQTRGNRNGKRARFQPEMPPGTVAQNIGGHGIEPAIARAILAGLLRHPQVITQLAEPLAQLNFGIEPLDALRMLLIEDAFGSETVLDSAEIIAICDHAGMGVLAHDLLCAKGLAFSFANPRGDAAGAAKDLEVAIETLAARPELDAALAIATQVLSAQWDEEGFAEQQRLLSARRAADEKLAALVQNDGDLG